MGMLNFSALTALLLAAPSVAFAQNDAGRQELPSNMPESRKETSKSSPSVRLGEVGKQLSPGQWVVNPDLIKGKALIVPKTELPPGLKVTICIGKKTESGCIGVEILIEK